MFTWLNSAFMKFALESGNSTKDTRITKKGFEEIHAFRYSG